MADPDLQQLLAWSEALSGIARTGLGFTQSLYEQERFAEVLKVASEMRAYAADQGVHGYTDAEAWVGEWMKHVGEGVPGYVTPKVGVGAIVGNDEGQILLVQRADSGVWLYPTGWADVGYSPAEVAQKEVLEETGIRCEVISVLGVIDGMRLGFTRVPLYSVTFLCRAVGGELRGHPLETRDVGWFHEHDLPDPVVGLKRGIDAFAAIRGEVAPVHFDLPRRDAWDEHEA